MRKIISIVSSVFPDLSWVSLAKTSYPRIRFYFDRGEIDNCDLSFAFSQSNDIFQKLLLDNQVISIISFFNDSDKLSESTIYSIKERGIDSILSGEKLIYQHYEDLYYITFFGYIDFDLIPTISKAILEQDFSIDPILPLNVYYFSYMKKILFHLYDNRGMDLIAYDKEYLRNIYNTLKDFYDVEFFE